MSIAMHAAPHAPDCGPACCRPAPRARAGGLGDTDRNFAVAIHLSPFAAFVFGPLVFTPLVLWLIRKDESPFVDDHGRESVNALLSFALYHVIGVITIIGIAVLPVLWIVAIVNLIRGAVAAGRGEYFRYPMTIRFLS